jgi:hypothetical protein
VLIISRLVVVLLAFLLTVACAAVNNENKKMEYEPGALDIIICEEPRPQVCTREYDPVCAKLQDGSVKTYATGCTSCSDSKVESYTKGACGVVLFEAPNDVVQ